MFFPEETYQTVFFASKNRRRIRFGKLWGVGVGSEIECEETSRERHHICAGGSVSTTFLWRRTTSKQTLPDFPHSCRHCDQIILARSCAFIWLPLRQRPRKHFHANYLGFCLDSSCTSSDPLPAFWTEMHQKWPLHVDGDFPLLLPNHK